MADGTILIYENSTFSSRNIAHSVKHQERERERDWCPKRWRLREIFKKRWNPDETRKEERRGNDVRPKGRKGESGRGREEVEQRGGGRRDGDDDGWIHRNPMSVCFLGRRHELPRQPWTIPPFGVWLSVSAASIKFGAKKG